MTPRHLTARRLTASSVAAWECRICGRNHKSKKGAEKHVALVHLIRLRKERKKKKSSF